MYLCPARCIPGNSRWECAAGSPNPDPFSGQKICHFPHLILDLASKNPFPLSDLAEAEIMLLLLRLERQQKDFLKSIWNLHITLSFLFIWN